MSAPIAIVAGALGGKAGNGGHAWSRISLVLGLRRLGFEVLMVEQLEQAEEPERAYFDSVCAEFDIQGILLNGPPPSELVQRAEAAVLLLNVGGHLTVDELKQVPAAKVYLDDDPGYTQLWQEAGLLGDRLKGHDFHFTFGQNIGRPGCLLPTNGIEWRPLRPPVVLDEWPVSNGQHDGFTTIASWRGAYGRVEADGHLYGQKAHQFRRFVQMPERVDCTFEIALDIGASDASDADLLRSHGWRLVDPIAAAAAPGDFRRYVQGSGAEFSVAQGIYVETRCGWFSDRTTRYLASGKPAVVQDTGFTETIRTGEGLIAFATLDEAVAGAEAIFGDYEAHAQAARAIAEEQFDSGKVLGRMLEEVGL
jgi:hypothetical protein